MADASGDPDVTSQAEGLLDELTRAVEPTDPEIADAAKIDIPRGFWGFVYRLRVGIERITTYSGGVAWVLAWVVFVLGFFNVVTRYLARFIERDIIVGEVFDLQWMLFGVLFLIALNYGVREGVNPRIDFWWANFKDETKARIDLVFHVLLFLPFLWVSTTILYPYAMTALGRSFDGSWDTWKLWEIWEQSGDAGGLPRGPIKLMMLVGFLLFGSQIIAEIIKSVFVLRGRKDLAGMAGHEAPIRIE